MIPGAVNTPWTLLDTKQATPESVGSILAGHFGARSSDGKWDFSNAKTLALYCNGMWCSQSSNAVKLLLHYGYPPEKLKWYRGGMQDWEILGLTTVKLQE
jgi:rhodanese-related sulfurtransferase